jgi:hypothetical protein
MVEVHPAATVAPAEAKIVTQLAPDDEKRAS